MLKRRNVIEIGEKVRSNNKKGYISSKRKLKKTIIVYLDKGGKERKTIRTMRPSVSEYSLVQKSTRVLKAVKLRDRMKEGFDHRL